MSVFVCMVQGLSQIFLLIQGTGTPKVTLGIKKPCCILFSVAQEEFCQVMDKIDMDV